MKHYTRIAGFLLIACALCLAACGPTTVNSLEKTDAAKQMNAQEIIQLVEGNTLFLHSFSEDSYFFFDGGSSKIFAKDTYNNKDLGTWDVSNDDELCLRMSKWWFGDLQCYTVHAENQHYFLSKGDGVIQFRGEQIPGDGKGLFYAVKDKRKKSARQSARSGGPVNEQDQKTASTENQETEEEVTAKPSSARSLVEESSPAPAPAQGRELRSTVKWMAKDCPGCNLTQADLKKADLVAANLQGANLREANLRTANLRRADLSGANLEGADLGRANLPGANLKNANLKGADLSGANLIRADLTGAKLEGAKLEGALTEGAIGLK